MSLFACHVINVLLLVLVYFLLYKHICNLHVSASIFKVIKTLENDTDSLVVSDKCMKDRSISNKYHSA